MEKGFPRRAGSPGRAPRNKHPISPRVAVAEFTILPLSEIAVPQRARAIEQATEVFFETANTTVFESALEKEAFHKRWFGHYLETEPASFFVAVNKSGACIGYLAGCLDSFSEATRIIVDDIAFYTPAFCAVMRAYPSHFHINVKPGHQGKGAGRRLVARFLEYCKDRGSPGVHVATGTESPAVHFYAACGFERITIPQADPDLALLVRALPAV